MNDFPLLPHSLAGTLPAAAPAPAASPSPSPSTQAAPPTAPAPRASDTADQRERAAIERAAVQFEGMFIAQMLGAMREATATLNAANGERDDTAGALLDHAYREVANGIATQRAFGIADTLIAQMLPAAGAPHEPVHPPTQEQGS